MSATRTSGELFAGVGGLGMAVDEVFGTEPAWFCEFDSAPSKVLAYHYPGVPNFGDVTKLIDPPRVSVLAGGFPCQDVSLAGRRRGLKDGTRSGLWSEFARLIDTIRPDWVIIENVRGLLSADATGDMESCPWCVGDGGAEHHLRALGAVLGDLAELGFDAEWTGLRAADVGAPHGRFRVFILAWPAANTRSGEPERRGIHRVVAGETGAREGISEERERDGDAARDSGRAPAVKLLSTPDTVPDAPNTGSNSHKAGNVVGLGNQVLSLLPTPEAKLASSGPDYARMNREGSGGDDLTTTIWREGLHLLPTPQVADGTGGHATRSGARADELLLPGAAVEYATNWGPYATAIERWESIIGRPAPAPVRMDGKGGKARLNPALCEFMMGWPEGWVTAPEIGLTRAEQLKGCGNGVVTLQAVAALRELTSRPGVPPINWAVAA